MSVRKEELWSFETDQGHKRELSPQQAITQLLNVLILGTLNQESKTLIVALLQKEILVSSSERAKIQHYVCNKGEASFLPSRHLSLLPHHPLLLPHGAAGSRAACPGLALCTAQSRASLSRPTGACGATAV